MLSRIASLLSGPLGAFIWGGLGIVLVVISIVLRVWSFAGLAAVLVLGAIGVAVRAYRVRRGDGGQ
jgi:hypothetical protein